MGALRGGPPSHRGMHEQWHNLGREKHDLGREMRDLCKDFRHEARWASPDIIRRVRDVVARAGREIEEILRQPETGAAQSSDDQTQKV